MDYTEIVKYIRRPQHEEQSKRRHLSSISKSAIFGALLLALGCFWLGWLILGQHTTSANTFIWPLSGGNPTPTFTPAPQLLAAGIDLTQASSNPGLSQQQAVLIANQLEPVAATSAKTMNARYVLLNYAGNSTHASLANKYVWMIVYQHISSGPNNTFVDPNSLPSYHDLYVFVDATSGKELLSVWV